MLNGYRTDLDYKENHLMKSRFEYKVILITGAASGLGPAGAQRVANEGAKLSLVDLNEEGLKETEKLIKSEVPDAEILLITADVSKEEDVKNYVNQTVDKFGEIDGFFNNVGIEGKQNLTEVYTSEEFEKVVSINLNGVFFGMKHVLKVMKEQGEGSIVNTASVGGIRGVGNQSGYSATKHGVVGLTRNSAVEYEQFGVNINAIAPGAIMTAIVEGSSKQMAPENWEEACKEFISVNPMKRFGTTEEVGSLAAFLLSESGFINGAVINIDGGQSYKY